MRAKGNWLHITGNVGASPVIDQGKGMEEVFAGHPDIKLLSNCDSGNSREGGRKCMEDMLQAFPAGQVDVVIADNDDAAHRRHRGDQGRRPQRTCSAGSGARTARSMACRPFSTATWSSPCRRRPSSARTSVKAFEDFKAGKPVEPLVFVPKETFDAHTPENRARVEERIKELKAMGVGCC